MNKVQNRLYPKGLQYLLANGSAVPVAGMARLVNSNWSYDESDEDGTSVTDNEVVAEGYAAQPVSIQFAVDESYTPPRAVLTVSDVEFPAVEAIVFALTITIDGGPALLALQEPSGLSSYPMELKPSDPLKILFPSEGAFSIILPHA